MVRAWRKVWALLRGAGPQRGQTLTEYALIIGFVVIALIAALTLLGDELQAIWNTIAETVVGIVS